MSPAFVLGAALAILVAVSLSLYRVLRGPTIIDRLVGVNVIGDQDDRRHRADRILV